MAGASAGITLIQLQDRLGRLMDGFDPLAFKSIWPGVAQMAVSDVKRNFAEQHTPDGTPWVPLAHGRPGQPAGGIPLRDTGQLMNSITGKADDVGITVGTNRIDAPLHQFGGIVTPKRSKFLAIPLTIEAKRAGSPRNFPGEFRFVPTKTGGWLMLSARPQTGTQRRRMAARDIENSLRVLEGKKRRELTPAQRTLLLPVPQFLLVHEVTVPARRFLGFSDKFLESVGQLIGERAAKVLGQRLTGTSGIT